MALCGSSGVMEVPGSPEISNSFEKALVTLSHVQPRKLGCALTLLALQLV